LAQVVLAVCLAIILVVLEMTPFFQQLHLRVADAPMATMNRLEPLIFREVLVVAVLTVLTRQEPERLIRGIAGEMVLPMVPNTAVAAAVAQVAQESLEVVLVVAMVGLVLLQQLQAHPSLVRVVEVAHLGAVALHRLVERVAVVPLAMVQPVVLA